MVVMVTAFVSVISYLIFLRNDFQFLALNDSIPRLNIARKVVDNLTPGLGQLGAIWPPFPHILNVPFIWNDWVWHTGISGSAISMIMYIMGGYFSYHLCKEVLSSKKAGILGFLAYLSNPSLWFLQASPMSESFFLTTMMGGMYYLICWIKKRDFRLLLICAIYIIFATLTRYEAYVFGLVSGIFVVIVGVYSQFFSIEKKKGPYLDGIVTIFGTLSVIGILSWMLYLALIFGDPILFVRAYTSKGTISRYLGAGLEKNERTTSQPVQRNRVSENTDYKEKVKNAVLSTTSSTLLMNGFFITVFSIVVGSFIMIYDIIRGSPEKRMIVLYVFCLGLAMFTFIAYGVYSRFIPPLEAPSLKLSTFFESKMYDSLRFNIRYGYNVLPVVIVFFSYVFYRYRLLFVIGIVVLVINTILPFTSQFNSFFLLQKQFKYNSQSHINAQEFSKMYDGGYILISDIDNQYFIFNTGIQYRYFIHEGTQNYWLTSLRNPKTYARWIILNQPNKRDAVRDYLQIINRIEDFYSKEYNRRGFEIYKIRPEFEHYLMI